MKKLLFAACLLLLCNACSSPIVVLKSNLSLQRIGVSFKRGEHSIALVADQLERTLDDFIIRYNASPKRKFELYKTAPGSPSSLTIELVATKLVSSGQQTAGVIVTMIGLSLPIIMASAGAEFVIFFWYFPDARSLTYISLSDDIADPVNGKKDFVLSSPGFLKSPERQIYKHSQAFDHVLLKLVSQFEKQLQTKSLAKTSN